MPLNCSKMSLKKWCTTALVRVPASQLTALFNSIGEGDEALQATGQGFLLAGDASAASRSTLAAGSSSNALNVQSGATSDRAEPPAFGGVEPGQCFNVLDDTCNLAQWELDIVREHVVLSGAEDARRLERPEPNSWITSLPPGAVPIYIQVFSNGFRLSLNQWLWDFFGESDVLLYMLHANSWMYVIGFVVVLATLGIPNWILSWLLFCCFFTWRSTING